MDDRGNEFPVEAADIAVKLISDRFPGSDPRDLLGQEISRWLLDGAVAARSGSNGWVANSVAINAAITACWAGTVSFEWLQDLLKDIKDALDDIVDAVSDAVGGLLDGEGWEGTTYPIDPDPDPPQPPVPGQWPPPNWQDPFPWTDPPPNPFGVGLKYKFNGVEVGGGLLFPPLGSDPGGGLPKPDGVWGGIGIKF